MDIHQMEEEQLEALYQTLRGFKGQKPLLFNVYDTDKKIKLTLNSKKQKIAITQELLNVLDEQQWHYKLN